MTDTATTERPTARLSKGLGFRAGAATHSIMKGDNVEMITPGEFTATELLAHLGGDFQVAKRPLYVETESGVLARSGLYAVVEGDDVLHGGAVSERYPILQYTSMAAKVDETIAKINERLGVRGEMEGLFLLRGGGLVIFIVDFGINFLVGDGNDYVEQKLIMSTGHGGESAVRSMFNLMRFACENQLPSLTSRYSRRGGVLYEQHTDAGLMRVEKVAKLAVLAAESAKSDKEIAEILSTIPQGIKDLERYLREGPGKFTATSSRGEAALETKVDRVLTRFASEPQNAWGAFNSIGWYEETAGDTAGHRQLRTLNRAVEGNATPRALKYVDFVLPDSVKAKYAHRN
jgi:hypothetical protein